MKEMNLPSLFLSKVKNTVLSIWINIIGWELALVYSFNWFGTDLVFRYDNFVLWKFAQTTSNKSSQPGVNYVESFTTLPRYLLSITRSGWSRFNRDSTCQYHSWWWLMIRADSQRISGWLITADWNQLRHADNALISWSESAFDFVLFIHLIVGFTAGTTIKTFIVVDF